MSSRVPSRPRSRPYMMAVVLGTALSAFGPEVAVAGQSSAPRAVQNLGRYCTACWRNARLPADAWDDCTQEVFSRLLQRVPTSRWSQALRGEGEERREFLRAIDAVKKRTQRARRHSGAVESAADDRASAAQRLDEDREAVRLAAAELLTARQQRILQLSFEGWSVQEIGAELNLPVERVSDEKYKAVRKSRGHLGDREC